jgi:putative colanic acid biosynthesis glycosyltransferase
MTINPLLSIITITKNNLSGLHATQESLPRQGSFEWIVVDGNSSDGTKEYLSNLSARIIQDDGGGIYAAMNAGMDSALGDYLIFMNAGDRFADPDILGIIEKAIAAEKPDFLYGDALEQSGLYKKARGASHIASGMITHHQAMIYRRTALRYDTRYTIAADYDFTARVLMEAQRLHYIPCAICIFENGGVSEQRRKTGRREQFAIRQTLGLANPLTNCAICTGQSVSAFLKDHAPRLYIALRSTIR